MPSLIDDEVIAMAGDALVGDLPVTTAIHLRNEPEDDASGAPVDHWTQIGTWEGRLREDHGDREVVVASQVQAQSDLSFVMRPYGFGVQTWKQIRPEDRLRINDQEYDVIGDDAGRTGAFLIGVEIVKIN
jgi:hypothetical protein